MGKACEYDEGLARWRGDCRQENLTISPLWYSCKCLQYLKVKSQTLSLRTADLTSKYYRSSQPFRALMKNRLGLTLLPALLSMTVLLLTSREAHADVVKMGWADIWEAKGLIDSTDLKLLNGFDDQGYDHEAIAASILADVGHVEGESILEVGAGAGNLAQYLPQVTPCDGVGPNEGQRAARGRPASASTPPPRQGGLVAVPSARKQRVPSHLIVITYCAQVSHTCSPTPAPSCRPRWSPRTYESSATP